MATYLTDEVTFDLPDGFTDRSLTILSSNKPTNPMSIVVSRDPREEKTLEAQVAGQLTMIQEAAPHTKVLGVRDRQVGNLPAREAKMTTIAGRQPLYVRQTWVSYYDIILSFSVTALRNHQQVCDANADRLLSNVKFRKR
jgi:hypothetical protein